FFSSRRRHTRFSRDWSSDVCSSDLWKSSVNKPHGYGWTNDIEVKIEQIFQFCRICRNESGHPHLPPNLDKGVLLANMGQFVKYIEDMYGMINYYKENNVQF